MALTPLYVGETHITWSLTWLDDSGAGINLTGSTVSGVLKTLGATTVADVVLSGTFTLTTPASGLFTYAPVANDLATAADYQIQFKATYGDGTKLFSDPVALKILPVL